MGHPTPPSPATSTDDVVLRERRGNASIDDPYPQNPVAPVKTIGSYAQGQSVYGARIDDENLTAHSEFSDDPPQYQDIVFSTYPRKDDTSSGFHSLVLREANDGTFSRYTPETSPPAHSRMGGLIPMHSGQAVSKAPTKYHTTRNRRAEKKNRDSRRRDPSRSVGKPLSEIALEAPDIFVPDAVAFATRPLDVRRREAADAGKIKRPLNAFMLYRRSYQNVAKTRCTRNNHQQVSAVCGDSWSSWEPPDIVSEFNRLAGVEKQMHEQAFPDYKYDPILTKKSGDDGNIVATLTTDASDPEYISRRRATKRNARKREARNTPRLNEPPQAPRCEGYSEIIEMVPPLHSVPVPCSFWSSPVLRPLPTSYDDERLTYIDHAYREQVIGSMEDQIISRSPSPMTNCLDRCLAVDPGLSFVGASIDPSLLPGPSSISYDGMLHGLPVDMQDEWCQQSQVRQDMGVLMPDLDGSGSFNAYLRGNEHDWEIEQLDEVSQFNDWISQTDEATM